MKQILFSLFTFLSLITQNVIAQDNVHILQLNKAVTITGLRIKLLHHRGYEPMIGTSVVFEVEYDGRKDIITMGAGGCESDPDFRYYWQGYTFFIADHKAKSNGTVKMEIIQKEITAVEECMQQETLQILYQKIKDLMQVEENQPGNKQMNITKTEDRLINVNYVFGWPYPQNKWEKQFAERLDIIGSELNEGYRFTLFKDQTGKITIKSNPTEENQAGIINCLNWVKNQSTN